MTHCLKCHRPLKNPSPTGLGPVCLKASQPVQEVERDLFGYDVAAAALVAQAKQAVWLDARVFQAQRELDAEFKAAWARWETRA
jgi:hypothetical protein